ALVEVMELRKGPERLLHFLDRGHRRGRVFARFSRGLADLRVVLLERRSGRTDLLELALEGAGLAEALLDLFLRLAKLPAEVLERRALLLQRVEHGLGLQRLRGQMLHGLAVLV